MEISENTKNPYSGGEWVYLESDKSVTVKISISNPNGMLEYYLKDNPHRQFIHYSKVKPITDYNLISELEKNYSGETGLLG